MPSPNPDTTSGSKIDISQFSERKVRAFKLVPIFDDTKGESQASLASPENENIIISTKMIENLINENLICRFCKKGPVELLESFSVLGFARHLYLRCSNCFNVKYNYSISRRFRNKISVGESSVSKRNDSVYQAVLGTRLAGIGKISLDFVSCSLGLGTSVSFSTFSEVNRDLLVVAEYIASISMNEAVEQMKSREGVSFDEKVHATVSYDGGYQKRGCKFGGGFARYGFVAAIDIVSGKVVSFDVACNSCPKCSELRHLFRKKELTSENYNLALEKHHKNCPANYRDFTSVSLESEIAPDIVRQAYERGVSHL